MYQKWHNLIIYVYKREIEMHIQNNSYNMKYLPNTKTFFPLKAFCSTFNPLNEFPVLLLVSILVVG